MRSESLFRRGTTIALVYLFLVSGFGTDSAIAQAATSANTVGLANPASQFCGKKGGQLTLEKNGKGGQFGVCTFTDNRQCEEWALFRGACPVGGIRVTGYVTPAARYCAITGGAYKITAGSNTDSEQGTCTLKGGKVCDAAAYFDGTCSPNSQAAMAENTIKASFACDGGKAVNAVFVNGPSNRVKLSLSDGRTLSLQQVRSGSGARYANGDGSVVFWNKGDMAFIEEGGKNTYDGCVVKR